MNKTIKVKSEKKMTGTVLAVVSKITDKSLPLYTEILRRMKAGLPFMEYVREFNKLCKVREQFVDNLDPKVGRTMIANNLTSSSPTNDMQVNYTALGTGTTSPANVDVALETETYRKETASAVNADNVAYISAFYSASEVNGTFRECGLFSDATGVTDSGILVVRSAINITKQNTETLTIDHSLTIS